MFAFIDSENTVSVNTDSILYIEFYHDTFGEVAADILFKTRPEDLTTLTTGYTTPERASLAFHFQTTKET